MMQELEKELKEEEEILVHKLKVGETAAAVTLQANTRGGALRSHYEDLGRQAATVSVQAAQRGHMERREVKDTYRHPIIDIKDSAMEMLKRLDKGSEPMLKFEDRTTVIWETKGTKDLKRELLVKRGRIAEDWDEEEKKKLAEEKERKEKEEAEKLGTIKNFDSIWRQKRLGKVIKTEDQKRTSEIESKVVVPDTKVIVAGGDAPVFEDPSNNPDIVPNYKTLDRSSNSKEPAKINNLDMLVWLGKAKQPKVPLDKGIRAERRKKNFSAFADFVDESIRILDDYKDRERMLRGVGKLKTKAKEMIYKDEKDFQDCVFRDQLKHEHLHEMPLVSQRKFQQSVDNYKRDEKEMKMLMATIRRIDKFDCTMLACKLTNAHIDDNWCYQIARAINGNDFLQQLYLSGNYITDNGATALADALKRNWALKILNLSGNLITDDGAHELGEMLKVNKHLVDLNLEFLEVSQTL
jgi:hypothetical protein